MFRLNSLQRMCERGKCLSNKWRNNLETFVLTVWLNEPDNISTAPSVFLLTTCQPHPTSQSEYISVLQRVIGSKDFTVTKSQSKAKVIEMTLPFQAIYGILERNTTFFQR